MQVNDAYSSQTPIEGVLHAFTRIGRRLKGKQPGDTLDHSAHVVLFVLRCSGALRLSDLAGRSSSTPPPRAGTSGRWSSSAWSAAPPTPTTAAPSASS